MYFKYSSINVQIIINFMYGISVPILFFVTLYGLITMYICEKLQLAYYYRKPPIYDGSLTNDSLSILMFAPVFLLIFGYWVMGNR